MSDTKAAPYFKNKHREHDDEDLEAHMPQYQNLGIEPEKNPSGKVPFHTKIAKNVELSSDNTTTLIHQHFSK